MPGTTRAEQGAGIAATERASRDLEVVLAAVVARGGALERAMSAVGIRVTNRIKRALQHVGSGVIYRRGGVTHRASAPGEPPATDLGRLVQSYTWVAGHDELGAYVDIGTNVEYAVPLEYGSSRMQPRPHFRPAVEAERDAITRLVGQAAVDAQRAALAKMPRQIVFEQRMDL